VVDGCCRGQIAAAVGARLLACRHGGPTQGPSFLLLRLDRRHVGSPARLFVGAHASLVPRHVQLEKHLSSDVCAKRLLEILVLEFLEASPRCNLLRAALFCVLGPNLDNLGTVQLKLNRLEYVLLTRETVVQRQHSILLRVVPLERL